MVEDTLFGLDGTQALPPLPAYPDPVGGLITGSLPAPEDASAGPALVVAQPVEPDHQAVRAMVATALAHDQRRVTPRPPRSTTPQLAAPLPRRAATTGAPQPPRRSSGGVGGRVIGWVVVLAVAVWLIVELVYQSSGSVGR
jgi:hypothetical protein